jgi:Flp pilus assembly protein TadD
LNKDNLLYILGGILVGFVAAYVLFEVMLNRQPPRLTPALRTALVNGQGQPLAGPAADPNAGGDSDAAMAAGGAPAGPSMPEIEALRQQVEKNPNDADAVRKLANLNFDIRNWQRAQELYRRYLEIRPQDPDVMTDLGIAYRESRDFDKALEQFNNSQKLAPDHWQSYYNEVVVLAFDLKRMDEAGQVLAELQRLQPVNPDVARLAEAVNKQRTGS